MKQHVRVISDARLVIFSLIFFIVCLTGCTWAIWVVDQPGTVENASDTPLIQAFFIILISTLLIGLLLAFSRSIVLLTLTHETIVVQRLFAKRESFSYGAFPFIYHGTYFHGNILGQGFMMHFIVFSQKRLSAQILNKVNDLTCSHDVFKIRYTKRIYTHLSNIIPSDVKKKIDLALMDYCSKD